MKLHFEKHGTNTKTATQSHTAQPVSGHSNADNSTVNSGNSAVNSGNSAVNSGNSAVNSEDSTNSPLVYIARQPIFTESETVYAYELLYRSTEQNSFPTDTVSFHEATSTLISESLLNFGIEELTNGKKAFINFADSFLLNQAAYLLDPNLFTIEILENVVFSIEVIDALYTLKAAGFDIALDDYVGTSIPTEILPLIDIIKIDYKLTTSAQRAAFIPHLLQAGKILLAEKVETIEDVEEARNLGCTLFQGYYYSKPILMKKNRMDISSSSYVKLAREISQLFIDLDKISAIISNDVHLTYKLLKRVKTLRYYRGNIINSIKRALVMMGQDEVRRWTLLIFIKSLADRSSDERIRTGLIRAFMCERLAEKTNYEKNIPAAFTTGMFSVLMYNINSPHQIFSDVEIPPMIEAALSGEDNILRSFLDLTLCYENGDWERLTEISQHAGIELKPQTLTSLYLSSVNAADESLSKDC